VQTFTLLKFAVLRDIQNKSAVWVNRNWNTQETPVYQAGLQAAQGDICLFIIKTASKPPAVEMHNGGNDRFCARLKVLPFSLKYEWQFWSKFYHLQKKKILEEIKFFLIQL
jgi:hypothetical protein